MSSFKRVANARAHYWDRSNTPTDRRGIRIDVTFGWGDPSEVINVWDYRTGRPMIGEERGEVRRVLLDWLHTNYEEERAEQDDPTRNPRGEWLRAYMENK